MASPNVSVPTPTVAPSALTLHPSPFSNPLYFKTSLVSFLVSWPIAILCFVVYFYNLANYKNMGVTVKMVFFPVLLSAGILDNFYDIITNADVNKYDKTQLGVLIGAFTVQAVISLVYLAAYMYNTIRPGQYMYRRLPTSDEDEGDSGEAPMERWRRIIDEYATSNIIWALTVSNMMILAIYVARYITHLDKNFMREIDVALLSAVLLGMVIIVVVFDFALFKNPSSGSVFMHYLVAAVYSLNFTIDFQAQVGFCELLTLAVFFISVFLVVVKLKAFIELGQAATKKTN